MNSVMRRPLALLIIGLMCLGLAALGPGPDVAHAAKKKKGEAAGMPEAEVKKKLEPLEKSLGELLMKSQARGLFSPEDSGKLADIKFTLMDLMKAAPTQPLLVRPVYQAAVLCMKREQYEDAYELFSFLVGQFPADPYSLRAQGQIRQMKRRLGDSYFPEEPAPADAAAGDPAKAPSKDGTAATKPPDKK